MNKDDTDQLKYFIAETKKRFDELQAKSNLSKAEEFERRGCHNDLKEAEKALKAASTKK